MIWRTVDLYCQTWQPVLRLVRHTISAYSDQTHSAYYDTFTTLNTTPPLRLVRHTKVRSVRVFIRARVLAYNTCA